MQICARQAQDDKISVLARHDRFNLSLHFSDDISDVEVVCRDGSLLGPWAENAKRKVEMSQSGAAVRAFLRFMYTGEAEAAALDANLQEVLELAALYEQTDM